jgi:hypothetical protein
MSLTESYLHNRTGYCHNAPTAKRFRYVFVMQDSTDFDSVSCLNVDL